jgi:hypothetical protein
MEIKACPECQSFWDEYRECVSRIHQLRQAMEIALHSYDHEEAKKLQVGLDTLEYRSVALRRSLAVHQSAIHRRPGAT